MAPQGLVAAAVVASHTDTHIGCREAFGARYFVDCCVYANSCQYVGTPVCSTHNYEKCPSAALFVLREIHTYIEVEAVEPPNYCAGVPPLVLFLWTPRAPHAVGDALRPPPRSRPPPPPLPHFSCTHPRFGSSARGCCLPSCCLGSATFTE